MHTATNNATTPVHHSPDYPANKGVAPDPSHHTKQFPAPLGAPPVLHHSENWEQHKGEAPHRAIGEHKPFAASAGWDSQKFNPLGIYVLFGAIILLWATIPTLAALAFLS